MAALVVMLPLCAVSVAHAAPNGQGVVMDVQMEARCDDADFNHVGKAWWQGFYIGDRLMNPESVDFDPAHRGEGTFFTDYRVYTDRHRVLSEAQITLTAGETIAVWTEIIEGDLYRDACMNHEMRKISAADLKKGFAVTYAVVVTENAGRYKNNTASWEITYTFTPAK